MFHRMGCTPVYRGYGESMKGVELFRFNAMGCTVTYKGCGESLKGVTLPRAWGVHIAAGAALNH